MSASCVCRRALCGHKVRCRQHRGAKDLVTFALATCPHRLDRNASSSHGQQTPTMSLLHPHGPLDKSTTAERTGQSRGT